MQGKPAFTQPKSRHFVTVSWVVSRNLRISPARSRLVDSRHKGLLHWGSMYLGGWASDRQYLPTCPLTCVRTRVGTYVSLACYGKRGSQRTDVTARLDAERGTLYSERSICSTAQHGLRGRGRSLRQREALEETSTGV